MPTLVCLNLSSLPTLNPQHTVVNELRERLSEVWAEVPRTATERIAFLCCTYGALQILYDDDDDDENVIDNAIDQWRRHLRAVRSG